MSMINDYTVQRLSTQRQLDLAAEAANRRLARLTASGRRPWWHKLLAAANRRSPWRVVQLVRSTASGPM